MKRRELLKGVGAVSATALVPLPALPASPQADTITVSSWVDTSKPEKVAFYYNVNAFNGELPNPKWVRLS